MSDTEQEKSPKKSKSNPSDLLDAPDGEQKLGPEIDAALAGGGRYVSVGNGKVRKVLE